MEPREIDATLVVNPRYSLPDSSGNYQSSPAREAHSLLRKAMPSSMAELMQFLVRYDHFSLVLESPATGLFIGERPLTAVMTQMPDPDIYTPHEAARQIMAGTAEFVPARSPEETVYAGLLGAFFADAEKARESGMQLTLYRQSCIAIDPVQRRIRINGTKPDAVLLPEDLLLSTLPEEAMTEPFLLEHLVL